MIRYYKSKCGFDVEIYKTQGTSIGQWIGAILIPYHPASLPGWQGCEWDPEDGRCLGRDSFRGWDLELLINQRETRQL